MLDNKQVGLSCVALAAYLLATILLPTADRSAVADGAC